MYSEKMTIKDIVKSCQKYKLLYVEDDEISRETSLEMFKNFFINIDVAIDGEDGLKKFKNNYYDMIITDVNMPKLNGIEMFKAIREIDSEIPVLILSARNESSFFLDSIKLNVSGYLLKPLDPQQFITQISKIVHELSSKSYTKDYEQYLEKEVSKRTQELHHELYYDSVTGLLNRYSFFKKVKEIEFPIVFIIDIDKFKVINEFYGNSVGTLVLKKFAQFLTDFSTTKYEVFRLSGDEFILLENTLSKETQEYYEDNAKKLLEEISSFEIELKDDYITIDVSIGISIAQENMFETAKMALDYAKTHNKQFIIYNNSIDERHKIQDAIKWKRVIKNAIVNNNVVAVYQPIVDKNRNIIKYETLMRLRDSDGKLISPFLFLDIAIKTKMYNELSSIIITKALNKLKTDKILSMNFTYDDIKNTPFIEKIENFFKENPQTGSKAIFEITESQSIKNYDDVKNFIKQFRAYGVKIAIDEFGSGFSNFEYILEIEPDYLKIDGSLVKNIDTDKKSLILVKAIVQFSHELGIEVIAEYVHSETVFLMLKDMGVDSYQGFYFSEPLEEIN